MHNVKVWARNIEGKDYCFVYHEVGHVFDEKIQGWTTSTHEFDHWFDEQLSQYYAIGATEAMTESLLKLNV